jgi:hypothetical protein
MYGFLYRRCPRLVADILIAAWYFLLLLAVFYCAFEPPAEFRYLRL